MLNYARQRLDKSSATFKAKNFTTGMNTENVFPKNVVIAESETWTQYTPFTDHVGLGHC